MMRVAAFRFDFGTPRQAWCHRCSLPSVVEAEVYQILETGVWLCGTFRECDSCGGH